MKRGITIFWRQVGFSLFASSERLGGGEWNSAQAPECRGRLPVSLQFQERAVLKRAVLERAVLKRSPHIFLAVFASIRNRREMRLSLKVRNQKLLKSFYKASLSKHAEACIGLSPRGP